MTRPHDSAPVAAPDLDAEGRFSHLPVGGLCPACAGVARERRRR